MDFSSRKNTYLLRCDHLFDFFSISHYNQGVIRTPRCRSLACYTSSTRRNLPNNLPRSLQPDVGGEKRDTIMCFPTMLSLCPFHKQLDMWSESADLHLMFLSSETEMRFIYVERLFTESEIGSLCEGTRGPLALN